MKLRILLFSMLATALFLAGSFLPSRAVDKGSISSSELKAMIESSGAKVVLINFWATWCGPCRKEIPGLIQLREDYAEDDLAIMGISLDYNPKTVAAFNKKFGINYPIYMANPDVMKEYKIEAVPRLIVYDKSGLVKDHEGYMPTKVLRKLVLELVGKPSGSKE
jgi:thiol-disulfide isomerase/thioredoxin